MHIRGPGPRGDIEMNQMKLLTKILIQDWKFKPRLSETEPATFRSERFSSIILKHYECAGTRQSVSFKPEYQSGGQIPQPHVRDGISLWPVG